MALLQRRFGNRRTAAIMQDNLMPGDTAGPPRDLILEGLRGIRRFAWRMLPSVPRPRFGRRTQTALDTDIDIVRQAVEFSPERGREYARRAGLPDMTSKMASIGQVGDSQVDRKIHLIWLGGKRALSASEEKNIQAWIRTAEQPWDAWTVNLWMDGASQAMNEGLIGRLTPGLRVHHIDELAGDGAKATLDTSLARAAEKGLPPTQASDILRLMVLSKEGGIYVDIDVDPGDVDLDEPVFVDRDGIPFFGPLFQTRNDIDQGLAEEGNEDVRATYERGDQTEAFRELARRRLTQDVVFSNHFIVAVKDMPFLQHLLNLIVGFDAPDPLRSGGSRLAAQLVNNDTTTVTGYRLVQGEILELLGSSSRHAWNEAVAQKLVQISPDTIERWLTVGWLTDASSDA